MSLGWWIAIICGATCAITAIACALMQMADAYDQDMGMDAEERDNERE